MFGFKQFHFIKIVHPFDIGGDEDVGGRALLDLFGEHAGGGIRNLRHGARALGEIRRDRIQRRLHAGRCENDGPWFRSRLLCKGLAAKPGKAQCKCQGKSPTTAPPVDHVFRPQFPRNRPSGSQPI